MKISSKLYNSFYLLPIFVFILIAFIIPVIYTGYISFTNLNSMTINNFKLVGLANYLFLFKYGNFRTIIINSLIWTLASIVTYVPLGFALALIISQSDLKGKTIFYAILILPWAFPAFIALLVWQGMWIYPYGIMNSLILPMFHLPHVDPLHSTIGGWTALILTNDWLSFPYFMMVFYAGLQSIPRELYEIAELDGANAFARFRHITLPWLKRMIAFVTAGTFIYTWNNFYPIYIITQGGPGISTDSIVTYAYQIAFGISGNQPGSANYSLAAAWSTISTIIIIIIGIIIIKYTHILESFT